MDFTKKEHFLELRTKMLQKVYEALDDEPNAQLFKFIKDILESADIDMLDKKKDKSKLLAIIKKKSEEEILDEITGG